jgi:hypothetical protein
MSVTFPVLDFRTPRFEELHVAVYFVIGAPLSGGLTNFSLIAPAATLTADEQQVGAEGEPTRRGADFLDCGPLRIGSLA